LPFTTLGQEIRWAYSTMLVSPHGVMGSKCKCSSYIKLVKLKSKNTTNVTQILEYPRSYISTHILVLQLWVPDFLSLRSGCSSVHSHLWTGVSFKVTMAKNYAMKIFHYFLIRTSRPDLLC